ncbi:MAG: hypothetical protein U1E27_06960 [Kiritimatiellia bacterium]|nr:hypothetical protein [Kiritimatiellia bacterium]
MKELKSAERRFERAQNQWMSHQQVDLPAFKRWLHLTLGALEQELLREAAELQAISRFLDGFEMEQRVQRRSARALITELLAFAKTRDDGAEGNRIRGQWAPGFLMACGYTLWQEPRQKELDAEMERHRNRAQEENPFDDESPMDSLFNELDELMSGYDSEKEFFGDADDAETPFDSGHRSNSEDREALFRSLYRKLCRELHPDVAGEVTPRTRQMWQEVQDAYTAHDLDRMEALYAAWELKADPTGKNSTFSRIIAATRECLAGLRALQRNLRKAKSHPGWAFGALDEPGRTRKAKHLERNLKEEQYFLRENLREVRQEYQDLLQIAVRAHPRGR